MPTYEEELIQQSKDGDLDSFNQLVEKYQKQVYNLAMRMLGNRQDAEDATQEIFILAWKAIGSFRGGTFRTWIFRVAARSCTDEIRRRRGRQVDSMDDMFPENNPLPSSAESPDEHLLQEDLSQLISQHLLCLAEAQRLVVTLADLEGFTYEEIAQITNSSIGTVKSRLNRGRANLRDLLLKNRELLPPEFRLYK